MKLEDGSCTIFLNTRGRNETEVSEGLVRFLKFVTADLEESEGDFQDELVRQFQETIRRIKTDRQMGERYVIFEEMLKEEKQEGKKADWKQKKKIFLNSWKNWERFLRN